MRKLFLFALFLLSVCAGKVMAQNIQLHYDLGRALYKSLDERPWVTTTVEMFKADKWGALISLSTWIIQTKGWLLLTGKSAGN